MPAPIVIAGWIAKAIAAGVTAYEIGSLTNEIYGDINNYKNDINKAKEEARKIIQSIQEEIQKKIEGMEEVAILLSLAGADPQGQNTENPKGRGIVSPKISTAISQKIPFRDAISQVCAAADKMPVLNVKKKKGVSIKDIPKAKRVALEKLLAAGLESIDVDLGDFIAVRLKQLAASLIFEFIDECLNWTSPLKTEVCFGPPPLFEDHPVDSNTKLKRIGDLNPFYPAPIRRRGSISADLLIPEYRHQRPEKANIFAIVEIKFPNDSVRIEQFDAYELLLDEADTYKSSRAPVRFNNKDVKSSARLSLFRYPEDIAVYGREKNKNNNENEKSSKNKKGKRS